MSPEALIGMEVGKGVLQRLLGQGSMGAVYLASQPQRQVAIKIFFPATQLEQADHEEFQRRLLQVLAQNALLNHKHILRVLDYGAQSGFLYQVMPYVAGESLQQLLAQSGPLPLTRIQRYLDQLCTALDYAHAHGVLHRDVKSENILLTPHEHVLLTDFGLAGLTTEKNFARVRRATPNMLDTIAPEYVLSQPADKRADLYSLGVVLYQMVTGQVPFQHTSIIEVALQHVKTVPSAPCSLRPDLPPAAEQVIMRALAKTPAERYSHAQELATAFRLALLSKSTAPHTPVVSIPAKSQAAPRNGGLFDPKWQAFTSASPAPAQPSTEPAKFPNKGLKRPSRLDLANLQVGPFEAPTAQNQGPVPLNYATTRTPSNQLTFNESVGQNTGTLVDHPSQSQSSVAQQVFQQNQTATHKAEELHFPSGHANTQRRSFKKRVQVIYLVLAVLVIVVGSSIFWFTQQTPPHYAQTTLSSHVSALTQIQATADANLILSDNLSQNTRNWVVGAQGSFTYTFQNGAYTIANADKTNSAPALLPNKVLSAPFVYSLTMEQLQGDLSSPNNQFGMLLDTTVQSVNGKQIDTFYAFEVVNKPGGQYQFWKYDNRTDKGHPWTLLWSKNFGPEFLQGSGPAHINMLKVIDTSKNFVFMVNGTQVGMWQDSSFTSGSIGMLVNLNGAEVAFSHLLVTYR